MGIKRWLSNVLNHLGVTSPATDNVSDNAAAFPPSNCDSDVTPTVTTAGGRPEDDFDLLLALRLHNDGLGYRAIAQRLGGNCSHMTVKRRLRQAEAAAAAMKPEPVILPAEPALLLQPIVETTLSHMAPQVISPAAPGPRATVPEPITNADALTAYWEQRGRPNWELPSRFFLVRGEENTKFATGSEQFCVGVESWRPEYQKLDIFKRAEKIWILLDASQDNRAFLQSLASDPWMRERCLVTRIESGGVLSVFRARLTWQRMYQTSGSSLADEAFERAQRFVPLPASNCVRELDALLAPAPRLEPEAPQPTGYSTFGGMPSVDAYLTPEQKRQVDTGDRSCGMAGTD